MSYSLLSLLLLLFLYYYYCRYYFIAIVEKVVAWWMRCKEFSKSMKWISKIRKKQKARVSNANLFDNFFRSFLDGFLLSKKNNKLLTELDRNRIELNRNQKDGITEPKLNWTWVRSGFWLECNWFIIDQKLNRQPDEVQIKVKAGWNWIRYWIRYWVRTMWETIGFSQNQNRIETNRIESDRD